MVKTSASTGSTSALGSWMRSSSTMTSSSPSSSLVSSAASASDAAFSAPTGTAATESAVVAPSGVSTTSPSIVSATTWPSVPSPGPLLEAASAVLESSSEASSASTSSYSASLSSAETRALGRISALPNRGLRRPGTEPESPSKSTRVSSKASPVWLMGRWERSSHGARMKSHTTMTRMMGTVVIMRKVPTFQGRRKGSTTRPPL